MVLSADKERLKSLLKETITLLCRNGLAFKSKFSIEALIGVTLDEDDIFLISINELIQTELNSTLDDSQICNDEASDGSSISDGSTALVERHRSRKRRHPQHASIKMEPLFSEVGDQSQNDDQEQDGDGDGGNGDGTGGGGDGASDDQSSAKKPHTDNNDDGGQDNGDNHDEDSKDIVFIKQEIDTWSNDVPSTAQSSTSYQGTSGSQGNMNFSLSDMNLVPISSRDEGGMMWQSNTQQPLSYLHQSSTTLTSSVQQPGDMQLAGQQPQQAAAADVNANAVTAADVTTSVSAAATIATIANTTAVTVTAAADVVTAADVGSVTGDVTSARRGRQRRCAVCGKQFTSRTGWKAHVDAHYGRYRYVCPYCMRGFYSRSDLIGHLVRHTGLKQYRCTVCGNEYRYKSDCSQHMKRKHGMVST